MIKVTPHIQLDESEIEESFIRASGPGGQNVNKVETAVQLRFDAKGSPNLPEAVFQRLVPLAGQRMTKDGVLVLTASEHRSQERNRKAALERLIALLKAAAVAPRRRRPTRPTRASQIRRLESKQHRGKIKKARRRTPTETD